MIKLGWIERHSDPVEQLRSVLQFYGISAPDQMEIVAASFRKSPAFEANPIAITTWLRQGEREAQDIHCASYDEAAFRALLVRIRGLTQEPVDIFRPQLVAWCAAVGVAVVFVPELPRTHVSGATRWLSPTKALIQLSVRYKTDDHLWFTFFHEAGHIVLHGKRDTFLESNQHSDDQEKEDEANRFATDMLIAPVDWESFVASGSYKSHSGISAFAHRIGIAPGIVVGRLQHHAKLLPVTDCNRLKRRFAWIDTA